MKIQNILKGGGIAAIFLASNLALATHIPGPGEPVEYDGSAVPAPVTGSIGFSSPIDGYDWYCINVSAGQQVNVTLTRTSGDLLLNGGATAALATPGETWGDISGSSLAQTSNDTNPDVSYGFTPATSGVVTLFVSTWLNEAGGDYSMTVTGAERAACGAQPPARAVPTMSSAGLLLLMLTLVIVAGFSIIRRIG